MRQALLLLLLASLLAPWARAQQITILAGSASDQYYTGTACNTYGSTPPQPWSCPYSDAGLTGSQLAAPYTSLRYGQTVTYQIPVPEGIYTGSVIFVEPNKTAAGQRLEVLTVQGQAAKPIDIFALAGAADRPYVFPFTAVAGVGILTISVTGQSGQNAVISGIVINPPPPQLVQWFSFGDQGYSCSAWKIPSSVVSIKYGCASPFGQYIGNYVASTPGGVEAAFIMQSPLSAEAAATPQAPFPFPLGGTGLGVICQVSINGTPIQLAGALASLPPNGATYACFGGPNQAQSGSMTWP